MRAVYSILRTNIHSQKKRLQNHLLIITWQTAPLISALEIIFSTLEWRVELPMTHSHRCSKVTRVVAHYWAAASFFLRLLPMWRTTFPCLISLKAWMASWWELPCRGFPLMARISSPGNGISTTLTNLLTHDYQYLQPSAKNGIKISFKDVHIKNNSE